MWHPKRQVCVPVPFTCPLFQVLNYPVTFCWKSSTRNVTSVDQTYGARHLPTRNIRLELSVGFLSAWLVCPTLLLPTCNIPHWRCTQKDPAQLLHHTPQSHKSWEGDSGSRRVVFGACSSKVELKTLLLGIEIIAAPLGQSL